MTKYRIPIGDIEPANNMGSVGMLRSGRIKRIEFALTATPTAPTAGGCALQVGSQTTFQEVAGVANPQVVAEVAVPVFMVTTATQAVLDVGRFPVSIDVDSPVQLGEIVYVNAAFIAGATDIDIGGSVTLIVVD